LIKSLSAKNDKFGSVDRVQTADVAKLDHAVIVGAIHSSVYGVVVRGCVKADGTQSSTVSDLSWHFGLFFSGHGVYRGPIYISLTAEVLSVSASF